MKSLFVFSILLVYVIFSIGVFALNNILKVEEFFDPSDPSKGKYRVALDSDGYLDSSSITYSKPVTVDPPLPYPLVRIYYYAGAGIASRNSFDQGEYHLYSRVPHVQNSAGPMIFNGTHTDSRQSSKSRDISMGSPDVTLCSANSTINGVSDSSSCEIPW